MTPLAPRPDVPESRSTSAPEPPDGLQVALTTAATFQESIRHADTKVVALCGLQGAILTFGVGRLDELTRSPRPGWITAVGVVCVLAMVVASAIGAWHLATAIRPRISGPEGHNRFAFPHPTAHGSSPLSAAFDTDPLRSHDEAWALVAVLAQIARAKHERIRRAMPWMLVSLAPSGGVLLLLTLDLMCATGTN